MKKKNYNKKKYNRRKGTFQGKKVIIAIIGLIVLAGFPYIVQKQDMFTGDLSSIVRMAAESTDELSPRTKRYIDGVFHFFENEIFDRAGKYTRKFKGVLTDVEKLLGILEGKEREESYSIEEIPLYSGVPYVILNDNKPLFTKEEITNQSFEYYSELDFLGRCGVTTACIGKDIMPTEERGKIGMIKPSGWTLKKYDIVEGKYLYNRCHLIGFQLTGENANEKNLITGTRSMNVDGMLPFENEVAEFVKTTGKHVMYRVTPIYKGTNLVASGVRMEAWSVEDGGRGVCFHVYVYNAQPGIGIDYRSGESWILE